MRPYWSLVRWMGHQRWFAAFGRTAMPVDRWIQRRTGGRWTLIGRHGMPALVLTTTGRELRIFRLTRRA
jgi:hypothetical protein